MGYIQGADRNQVILLPDTLDDYVGGDNEVRAIDAFIDSLDISLMGFKADPAKEGRPGYDPRDMLKLYMYGYLNHIRSSRRLQKEASRNVELMWLLRKVVPDFRCIADFRKDNAKSIREVFRAFVRLVLIPSFPSVFFQVLFCCLVQYSPEASAAGYLLIRYSPDFSRL